MDFLGGGAALGSEPGTLLGGCSLFPLSLAHREHLKAMQWRGLEGLCRAVAAVLRTVQVTCLVVAHLIGKKGAGSRQRVQIFCSGGRCLPLGETLLTVRAVSVGFVGAVCLPVCL